MLYNLLVTSKSTLQYLGSESTSVRPHPMQGHKASTSDKQCHHYVDQHHRHMQGSKSGERKPSANPKCKIGHCDCAWMLHRVKGETEGVGDLQFIGTQVTIAVAINSKKDKVLHGSFCYLFEENYITSCS